MAMILICESRGKSPSMDDTQLFNLPTQTMNQYNLCCITVLCVLWATSLLSRHAQFRILVGGTERNGTFRHRSVPFRVLVTTVFAEKTFTDCSLLPRQRMLHPQISSRIGTQTTRFMKVFSLESFPLYGRPSVCLNKGNKPCYHGDGY